jgi:hypothetical protein
VTLTPFCSLCGSTNPSDLGKVIGICLDATACHQRQYARLRDRADAATVRAEAAEAKVALIAEFCRDESEFLNTGTAGVAIVRARDILAIIGSEEETNHG